MMDESDVVSVARAQAGDPDAFRVLVERHSVALFRLAYRMTGNEQDAEDVVQDAFLKAYRQLNRFEARARFGTWLHRIVANAALDLLRKRKREDERIEPMHSFTTDMVEACPAETPTPHGSILNKEVQQIVESALDQLTPLERTAFVLRHFEGRSIVEISAALGVGASAAKQSVFRAVQKLRRDLEPMMAESL